MNETTHPAPTEPLPSKPLARWPILDTLLALAVVALAFLLASFTANNSDLWLHLAVGRDIAAGTFPFGSDPYSAVQPAPTWIHPAWLSDLLLYVLYTRAGGAVLVGLKAALLALLAVLLVSIRAPRGGGWLPAFATTLVFLAIAPALVLRPTVVSFFLFGGLAFLLLHTPRVLSQPGRFLPLCAALFLAWVNLDGGFVFGLLLLALAAAGRLIQGSALERRLGEPVEPALNGKTLLAALGLALVVCLANPFLFRVFRLPAELAPLTLPRELRGDPLFESFFRAPLSTGYISLVGGLSAGAFFLLFALSFLSFFANLAGWRWERVLPWAAFAVLGTNYWRLIPYAAILSGPILVLNLQDFLQAREARLMTGASAQKRFLLDFLAGAGRVLSLLGLGFLLFFAWPGWLAADFRAIDPSRRVAWKVEPEPNSERLAQALAALHAAPQPTLGPKGFHLQPDFAYYGAWFCPAEKGLFDTRLTAPTEVIADAVQLRRLLQTGKADSPESEALFRKLGVDHAALSGPNLLEGLALNLFRQPERWPLRALAGRGLITGVPGAERRPGAGRLDPIVLAAGPDVVPLPDTTDFPAPPPPADFWSRLIAPPPPLPPEVHEASLWLGYREIAMQQALDLSFTRFSALNLAAAIGQYAPIPMPSLVGRSVEPLTLANLTPSAVADGIIRSAWPATPAGETARAAALLALRASRRAIARAPDLPDGYQRLSMAYSVFDGDPGLNAMQQIVSSRQALDRLGVIASGRRSMALEESSLQQSLWRLYQGSNVPGTPAGQRNPPLDLMLKAVERFEKLRPEAFAFENMGADPETVKTRAKQLEAEMKRLKQYVESLRAEVQKRSDEYENAASKKPAPIRAQIACGYGLSLEALNVLRQANPEEVKQAETVTLLLNLLLLAGEGEQAHELLMAPALQPITQLPPPIQPTIRNLAIQTAAALGEYNVALENLRVTQTGHWLPLIWSLQSFVFPSIDPRLAGNRLLTMPSWGGIWTVEGAAWPGDLLALTSALQQRAESLARQGMLCVEQGDIARARLRFQEIEKLTAQLPVSAPRALARSWSKLLDTAARGAKTP